MFSMKRIHHFAIDDHFRARATTETGCMDATLALHEIGKFLQCHSLCMLSTSSDNKEERSILFYANACAWMLLRDEGRERLFDRIVMDDFAI